MNQRRLIKELELNSNGKIIDFKFSLLWDDKEKKPVKGKEIGVEEIKRLNKWEGLVCQKGDMYIQIIYRSNKKKKK